MLFYLCTDQYFRALSAAHYLNKIENLVVYSFMKRKMSRTNDDCIYLDIEKISLSKMMNSFKLS